MAGVLNQVMECVEQHRVDKQKQRIVLNSSLPYARRIDKINAEWQDALRKGERKGAGVEIIGFDITREGKSRRAQANYNTNDNFYVRTSVRDRRD